MSHHHLQDICPLCRATQVRDLECETAIARVPFGARIVECTGCRLRRVSPQPSVDQLETLYEEARDLYRAAGLGYTGGTTAAPQYLDCRLGRLEALLRAPGRLLDVGAGSGAFLALAAARGWTVSGSERSARGAQTLSADGRVDIRVGDRIDKLWPAASFDAVHMNHVLEHVADPLDTLRAIRRVLKPGGVLAVEVPWEFEDLPFLVRRATGTLKLHPVPSQHLWFFSPSTLAAIVTTAGFDVTTLESRRDCRDPNRLRGLVKRGVGRLERWVGRGPLIELFARPAASTCM